MVKQRLALCLAFAASMGASACVMDEEDFLDQQMNELKFPDNIKAQLKATKAATAAYHDRSVAEADGYGDSGLACIEGMGFHWVKPELFGSNDVTAPGALVYAPDGDQRLVAAEWVWPIADPANPGEPPVLFERIADGPNVIGDFHFWAMHAFVWDENPEGVLDPTNPNIVCP